MNIESMRAKINEKKHLNADMQMECKHSFSERMKATFTDSEGRCSFLNTELTIGLASLLLPYILGFIVISVLCLSMVDISLSTYFKILAESFSVTGLWTIGYFSLSVLFVLYIITRYLFSR